MGRDERHAGGKASWGWVTEGENAVISRSGMAVARSMGERARWSRLACVATGNSAARHLIPPPNTQTASSVVWLCSRHTNAGVLQWFDATHRHEPSPALIALPTLPSPLTFAPL